jgi:deoxyribonuclease-4
MLILIGAHISAAGGVQNAPLNAHKHGAECYQFFSRSPQGGKVADLTPKIIQEFKSNNKKYHFKNFYIHSPYYINLASSNNRIFWGSISALKEELKRGSQLNVRGMMFHIGSAKDLGQKQAMAKVIRGLKEVVKDYTGSCQPLLEISAGAGLIIGDSFEEIAEIIKKTETKKNKGLLGVCFDTAHAFESGYDLKNQKAVKKTFDDFNKIIGLKRLKVIHANDSKTELGSHSDRHEHLGYGKIGLGGFQAIIKYFQNKKIKIDFIMETPTDEGILKDIKLLKKIRDKK